MCYIFYTKEIKKRMIKIKESKTADTRSCDCSLVTKEQLLLSSKQHVDDVTKGILFFVNLLLEASISHDHDKFSNIDEFFDDFKNNFNTTIWWEKHRKVNRHHLFNEDGVPEDVNLVDVIELIVDCVMAGMARTDTVYPLEISSEILEKAFQNTVVLLKNNVKVVKDE